MRDALGLAGLVLLVAWIVLHLAGCGLFGTAVSTASYKLDYDTCLAEAHDAGRSFAVFDRCAQEVDRKHGFDAGRD